MLALPWDRIWRDHAILRVHPQHLVGPEEQVVLDLWLAWRRDGLGGAGHLPFAGGAAQQPSALMRALDALSAASARIDERRKRDD